MAGHLNLIQFSEEIKRFLSKFAKAEHESVLNYILLFGISILNRYPKLNLTQLKMILKSSQQVSYTEQTIESLQTKIQELQQTISKLQEKTLFIEKFDKNTETANEKIVEGFTQSEQIYSASKKSSKKVDFWNQTEEKENLPQFTSQRACWEKKNEINWVQDFSSHVKNIPKSRTPIIRESRISILSNQDKAKRSSLDNYY